MASLEEGSAPQLLLKEQEPEERVDVEAAAQSKFKYQYLPSKALSDSRAKQTCNCPALMQRRDTATSLLQTVPSFAAWVHPWDRAILSPSLLMRLLSPFTSPKRSPSRCQD